MASPFWGPTTAQETWKPVHNKGYNRRLTPVEAINFFVPTAAIFLASKPELVQ